MCNYILFTNEVKMLLFLLHHFHFKTPILTSFSLAFHIYSDTFDSNHCLCILRMMDGLDISDQFDFEG